MKANAPMAGAGLAGVAGLCLLAACVTINITFPPAAAERAADRIIEDVWGDTPAPAESSLRWNERRIARALLDLVVPPASAAADINIDSPGIRSLKASMAERHRQLLPYYQSGAVGLTNDGLVALRDPGAVPLKERNRVKGLVDGENRDRNALYREIAVANGQPQWEDDIRDTFARRWIDKARSGWFYQDVAGRWRAK